jgi:predicted kinase
MKQELFILRGLPGSGKSTVAESLTGKEYICCADNYFLNSEGKYIFDKEKLNDAHRYCKEKCEYLMQSGYSRIVVSNTSTTEKELQPYYDLAKIYEYKVFSLICENRHNSENIHNVPVETLEKMKSRFQIKL